MSPHRPGKIVSKFSIRDRVRQSALLEERYHAYVNGTHYVTFAQFNTSRTHRTFAAYSLCLTVFVGKSLSTVYVSCPNDVNRTSLCARLLALYLSVKHFYIRT
jgi:hypothetical protein